MKDRCHEFRTDSLVIDCLDGIFALHPNGAGDHRDAPVVVARRRLWRGPLREQRKKVLPGMKEKSMVFYIDAVLASLLIFSIFDDLRNYRVRNEVIAALAGLFLFHALAQGNYHDALQHALLAIPLFCIMLFLYARGFMGGGDVKLLGVAFLWLEDSERMVFALLLFLLTVLYVTAAKLNLAPSRGHTNMVIPLAPCISGAWLLSLTISLLRG